jgi:hypothetical protein
MSTPVDTYSPEFRRQCLVRFGCSLRALRGQGPVLDFLEDYERRTKDKTLRDDVIRQWSLGNRGRPLEWKTEPVRG